MLTFTNRRLPGGFVSNFPSWQALAILRRDQLSARLQNASTQILNRNRNVNFCGLAYANAEIANQTIGFTRL
jgi:hypothetical protein